MNDRIFEILEGFHLFY